MGEVITDFKMSLLIAQTKDRCNVTKEVRIKTEKKFMFVEEFKEGEFRLCYSAGFEKEVNEFL